MSSRIVSTLRAIVSRRSAQPSFERLTKDLQVVGGDLGRCVCELTVLPEHANNRGTLHGGCLALLVDSVSTTALLSVDDTLPGVSVDLNISYMGAVNVGEAIVVDAQTTKRGKTLAFLTVDVRKKSDDSLVAQARHTKFMGGKKESS